MDSDFTPNGYKTFYWSNGNKRMEGEWVDGNKTGEFKYYNQNGELINTVSYSNGLMDGNNNKYLQGVLVMTYVYNSGTLSGSNEYLNTHLINEYHYDDAIIFTDPDAPTPPPVGTLYHSFSGEHPAELFKGTLWTYVENGYYLNDGEEKPVDIWLREPNGGKGPYIYAGEFKEYSGREYGKLLRKGTYRRQLSLDGGSTSNLHGEEYLYRTNGTVIYKGNWDNGVKYGTVTFNDDQDRVWKLINIGERELYIDGLYNILDIGLNGSINYDFDAVTQVATLRLLK